MYKEKQDKTKQNWAAASGTGMIANATVAAAGEATTAEAVGDATTAGVALTAAVAVVVGTPKTGPGTTLQSKANRDPPNLGEDNRKQGGEEDSQEGDAEEDETQAQRITQK
jgi:hypothetical protein